MLACKVRSAVLCNRKNAMKKRHYRLDLVLGKVSLREHPLFIREDRCATRLLETYEEYERVTSLGMIPFYRSRIKNILGDIRTYKRRKARGEGDEQEEIFLDQTLKDVKAKLKREKAVIRELGDKLYSLWKDLKLIRDKQGFTSTSYTLKVTETPLEGGKKDVYFHL
jgi:hypothetical protein